MRLIYRMTAIAVLIASCKSNPARHKTDEAAVLFAPDLKTSGPPAWVYKTRADYHDLVPVILSEDKSKIVSYPHPSDLKSGDTYLTPLALRQNYWLDNKGIGPHVAFLKMTYGEYAALKELPSLDALYAMIIDKDPLLELCNCGNKAALTHPVEQLNTLIDSGKLRNACLPVK